MSKIRLTTNLIAGIFTLFLFSQCATTGAQTYQPGVNQDLEEVLGQWDITVYDPVDGVYPSWFSITQSDGEPGGWFTGKVGNARPVSYVHYDGSQLWLSLPPQYERMTKDLLFVGTVTGDKIDGVTQGESGNQIRFSGQRAPELSRNPNIRWGKPVNLIRERLSNWKLRYDEARNGWKVQNGILSNTPPSTDLITRNSFQNFKLHAEFRIPKGSNSGIYLRGRYELQISDSYGMKPDSLHAGSVYGFISPSSMAIKQPGEWNVCDITLNGRWLTLVLNGETVIDNEEIPGITGGALNSREGEPGPIMFQGDHGPIEFRDVIITPEATQ